MVWVIVPPMLAVQADQTMQAGLMRPVGRQTTTRFSLASHSIHARFASEPETACAGVDQFHTNTNSPATVSVAAASSLAYRQPEGLVGHRALI
jgi:hypothetical protein